MAKVTYVANGPENRCRNIRIGGHVQFQNGIFTTEDEDLQALIESRDYFGVDIHFQDDPKIARDKQRSEHAAASRAKEEERQRKLLEQQQKEKAEAEAKEKKEAEARAKKDADDKLKAEAKARAEAEAKAKKDAEADAGNKPQ